MKPTIILILFMVVCVSAHEEFQDTSEKPKVDDPKPDKDKKEEKKREMPKSKIAEYLKNYP